MRTKQLSQKEETDLTESPAEHNEVRGLSLGTKELEEGGPRKGWICFWQPLFAGFGDLEQFL